MDVTEAPFIMGYFSEHVISNALCLLNFILYHTDWLSIGYVFMVWCLVKHRDNFTFTITFISLL